MQTNAVTALLLISATLAFAVGFCIQRASVCAVRAAEQWVYYRRTSRVRAFFSAAAWSGLVILPLAWLLPGSAMLAANASVTWTVLAAGALFGMGAGLNGACALGTVAQLTRGRTEYIATLFGIALGAMAAVRLGVRSEATLPSILSRPGWLGLAALVAFGAVVLPVFHHMKRAGRSPRLWPTTVASFAVLGICGGVLHGTAGNWSYTSFLAGAAQRALDPALPQSNTVALVCTLALFAGGISAAVRLRRFALAKPRAWPCAAKLAGGATMSFAAMMIPGGNDMLLLSGLPSLNSNAWAAYAAMMVALTLLLSLRRDLGRALTERSFLRGLWRSRE
jgi:hypothetical protein